MFQNISFLLLSLAVTASGQHNDGIYEEFVNFPKTGKHHYLRRDLQAVVTCQAIDPVALSTNDCSGTYPCMCGSTETVCPYCELETTRGHFCQVTGSTVTFVDPVTSTMKTCSCQYNSGQAIQSCYDTMDRAEPEPSTSDPIPIAPVSVPSLTAPPVTQPPVLTTPPVTQPPGLTGPPVLTTPPVTQPPGLTTPPVTQPPVPPQQVVTCQAVNPTTFQSNDCSGTYPCTCTGSTETSCTYCELDTTRGPICEVTGSSVTFVDSSTSLMTTCSCNYGNGVATKTCYYPASTLNETRTRFSNDSSSSITPSTEKPVSKKSKLGGAWKEFP